MSDTKRYQFGGTATTPTEPWEAAWLLDYPGTAAMKSVHGIVQVAQEQAKNLYRAGYLAAQAGREGELRKARLDLITEIFLLRGPWEERLGTLRTKYFTKGIDPNGNDAR